MIELAEDAQVSPKIAEQILVKFSEMAVRETKKKGMFVMPGIGTPTSPESKVRDRHNPGQVIKFRREIP